jgi:UDP-glucose 4-epimerase
LNVINACAQYDVPLINIAVGNWWMNNTYSITKNTVERFIAMKAKYEKRAMGSVRALNAYGPRQVPAAPYGPSRVRKIMPSFVCRALTGEPIEIYGDGMQIMDMIYVEDVAWILASAWEQLDAAGVIPVIEAGTGRETTVNDIATQVAKDVLSMTDIEATITHLPMRPGEDANSVVKANADTLAVLGVQPDELVTLEKGVHRTVAYYWDYLKAQ